MPSNEKQFKGITRREFLGTSAVVAGTLPAFSSTVAAGAAEPTLGSPLDTKLRVKFVVNGMIHEDAWEGSCRVGNLASLTYEAECSDLDREFDEFKTALAAKKFASNLEVLEPVKTHLWVQKGNPYQMLKEEQLQQLDADNPRTDVYVVTGGGHPQYVCVRIAERFKKPVIMFSPSGWAMDAQAGLRTRNLEGYYVPNWGALERRMCQLAARKAFANTRVLVVTNFPDEGPRGITSCIRDLDSVREKYGVHFQTMDYARFFGEVDAAAQDGAVRKQAGDIADGLSKNAIANNMTRDDLIKSTQFYLTTKSVMEKHTCNAFTIECFELCSSLNPWNRRITPCLVHALLKDSGHASACETDINALLAMMVEMSLSRKAVYMGNPQIDVEKNLLSIQHSVASLKMLGIDGLPTPYRIRAFTQAGFGATLRHDFNQEREETVTLARFDPTATKMLVTKGKITGGEGLEEIGCAQTVHLKIADGNALMKEQLNFGSHLAMVIGDYVEDVQEFAEVMRFEAVSV